MSTPVVHLLIITRTQGLQFIMHLQIACKLCYKNSGNCTVTHMGAFSLNSAAL